MDPDSAWRGVRAARAAGVALAALAAASFARAAEWEGAARVELSGGVDSNALREADGGQVVADAFAGALVTARGAVTGERGAARLALSEGAKAFRVARPADLLASRLDASGRLQLGERAGLGLELAGRDLRERGGLRDHATGRAAITGDLAGGPFVLRVVAGLAGVAPRAAQLGPFASWGPAGAAALAFAPARGHSLAAAYDAAWREFPTWRSGEGRVDLTHAAAVEYAYRGPVVAGAAYAFALNRSSALGGAYLRHRVTARVALFLPLGVALAAQGTLQRSSYPDGLFVAEQTLLADGDENQNALELRASRVLRGGLEAALKFSQYANELTGAEGPPLKFRRSVASLVLVWRGP